jgi:hypothetical protein
MVQLICCLLSERDIHLDARPIPWRRIDVEQAVHKFRTLAQIDHPQTATLVVGFVDRRHIETDPIVLDLQ